MGALSRTSWIEMKLFRREPLTLVVTLALPVVLLVVLGGVFRNNPDPRVYRGVGAMNFYVPAYIALVISSLGVVSLPTHLAAYRERGVLRRFRASSVPMWAVLGAQVVVMLLVGVVGSALLIIVAGPVYHIKTPQGVPLVILAFLLIVATFSAIGVFLASAFPTSRAAQGAGIMLWFVMLILGGAGPPPEVLPAAMRGVGDATPLRHAVLLIQDAWLGRGWNWTQTLILVAFTVGAILLALLLTRTRLLGER